MAIPSVYGEDDAPKLVQGEAASAPGSAADLITVKIPSTGITWQQVSWNPKRVPATMPAVGDECLCAFDENGNPWVICWA